MGYRLRRLFAERKRNPRSLDPRWPQDDAGRKKELLWSPGQFSSTYGSAAYNFDPHPDGKRFAVLKVAGTVRSPQGGQGQLHLQFLRRAPPQSPARQELTRVRFPPSPGATNSRAYSARSYGQPSWSR